MTTLYYLTAIYGDRELLAINEDFQVLRAKALELAKAKWGDTFYIGIDTDGEMRIDEEGSLPGKIYDIQVSSIKVNSLSMVDAVIGVFNL